MLGTIWAHYQPWSCLQPSLAVTLTLHLEPSFTSQMWRPLKADPLTQLWYQSSMMTLLNRASPLSVLLKEVLRFPCVVLNQIESQLKSVMMIVSTCMCKDLYNETLSDDCKWSCDWYICINFTYSCCFLISTNYPLGSRCLWVYWKRLSNCGACDWLKVWSNPSSHPRFSQADSRWTSQSSSKSCCAWTGFSG